MTQQNILQGEFNPTVPTRIVFGNEKIDPHDLPPEWSQQQEQCLNKIF